MFFFFFFQAEDGIRDLVRSRGLGDVYKRQTLVRLLEEKALRCHRTVVKVSRWFPSSRLCSECGFNSGKKPLGVRSWTCTECGVTHDRDLNAARNILVEGRMVAAGLAETLNARGGGVRLGLVPAAACEARTHQGAA